MIQNIPNCRRCKKPMRESIAILSTLVGGSPDMGEIVTFSYGGPGRLVDCWKCPCCGHSVTR